MTAALWTRPSILPNFEIVSATTLAGTSGSLVLQSRRLYVPDISNHLPRGICIKPMNHDAGTLAREHAGHSLADAGCRAGH